MCQKSNKGPNEFMKKGFRRHFLVFVALRSESFIFLFDDYVFRVQFFYGLVDGVN